MELFNELPKKLRFSVAMGMFNGAARKINLLRNRDPSFVTFVMTRLKPVMIDNNDYIYREGEYADEVIFLIKGRANLVTG